MNGTRQILVKVEVGEGAIIVRNEDRSVDFVTSTTKAIEKKLKGARRAFFYAEVKGSGSTAELLALKASASWQAW